MDAIKPVILSVENLSKHYRAIKAVDGISFDVYSGEVLGLLGPNGAGKSTTIDLITTLQQPDGGKIIYSGSLGGNNSHEIRRHIGIVPQELAIYGNLTVYDNLKYIGSMYGYRGQNLKKRIEQLLQRFDLTNKARMRARTLSGGLKRRLNFALADIHDPQLIVLDEPTVGLDPNARQQVWQAIHEFRQAGKTVLLTTHYMEEADILCDRIILIDQGHIVAMGSPTELKATSQEDLVLNYQLSTLANPRLLHELRSVSGIRQITYEGSRLRLVVNRGSCEEVKVWITGCGLAISGLQTEDISLEDVFRHYTGRSLQGARETTGE